MGSEPADTTRGVDEPRPLWICPTCGARLVTPHMWHSCGRFTLESLFDRSKPGVLDLGREFVRMLESLGDVQVIPQKTRLTCVARVRFAGAVPRKSVLLVTFALHRWLEDPRIVSSEDYGPGWREHTVIVASSEDLDGQLRAWLQESHDIVGLQRSRPQPGGEVS